MRAAALLRRALKGEALYRINTLVDALNLCSLRLQLPFGLYDFERVEPPVVLRRGRAGEAYEGIRKGSVSVGADVRSNAGLYVRSETVVSALAEPVGWRRRLRYSDHIGFAERHTVPTRVQGLVGSPPVDRCTSPVPTR